MSSANGTEESYIIFWKDTPGQQVSTVVDPLNQPVLRDHEYVQTNGLTVVTTEKDVLAVLERANGVRYAVPCDVARKTLGWDV